MLRQLVQLNFPVELSSWTFQLDFSRQAPSQTGATSAVLQLVTADPTETLPTLPSYVTATPGVRRPRDSEPGKRPVRRTGGQERPRRVLAMGAL